MILKVLLTAFLMTFATAADFIILDVRTPKEFKKSHLEDAILIDVKNPNFQSEISKLDKNKSYKLYCRTGNRSGKALEIMRAEGFTDLENLGSLRQASEKLDHPVVSN